MKFFRLSLLLWFTIAATYCSQNPFSKPPQSHDGFKILFSDPLHNSDGGILQELDNILNSATYSIDCAFNRLESQTILNTLLTKASQKNIKLRLAFDEDVRFADSGAKALLASGLFSTTLDFQKENKLLFGNKGEGRVYYTFCSVDERKNFFSTSGIDRKLIENTPTVAFIINTDQLGISREVQKEMNMLSQGLFGNKKSKLDFATKYSVLDQVIALYWGPQENPMDVLALELNDARHSIEIYTTGLENTDSKAERDLPTVLTRRLNRNIPIKMIVSNQALFAPNNKIEQFVGSSMELSQYFNNRATPSLNFIIMDAGTPEERVAFFSGSLRSRADSSDDSVLLILKGRWAVSQAQELFSYLKAQSRPISITPTNITTAEGRQIVINEIGWMGSMNNQGERFSNDEFIELYNPSATETINISKWRFACTTDNGSTNVNAHIILPAGAEIPPGGYFVVARLNSGAFDTAHYTTNKLAITDTSVECRLTDGDNTPSAWSKDPTFTGTVVDRVNPGVKFNQNATRFTSTTGMSDSNAQIFRSMERISASLAGSLATNWQSNKFTVEENILVNPEFRNYTFASPGTANSYTVPDNVPPVVTAISPEGNNIPIYQRQLAITFSKMMDDTTFSPSSLSLTGGTVDRFTGLSNNGRTANFLVTFTSTGNKTITVHNTVKDLQGNFLAANFSQNITVTTPPWAQLQITETDLKRSGVKDRIEFRVVSGGTLAGLKLHLYGSSSTLREFTFPELGNFNVGDMIVFHLQVAGTSETSANATSSTDEGHTSGFDIYTTPDNTNSLTSTKGTIEVLDPLGYSQDFMAYSDGSFGTGQEARIKDAALSGRWQTNGDSVSQTDLVNSEWASSTQCLIRKNSGANQPFQDQNAATDWGAGSCAVGTNQDSSNVVEPYTVIANSLDLNTVELVFSRPPKKSAAENIANYSFTPAVSITSANLIERTVILTTSLQSQGTNYTINLNSNLKRFADDALPPASTSYTTPQFIVSHIRGGIANSVWLTFTLPPLANSSTHGALNLANYNINDLTVLNAEQVTSTIVKLTTSPQTPGNIYNITVSNSILRADGEMNLGSAPPSFTALNLNPSFESGTTNWSMTTSGSMVTDIGNNAFHGERYFRFDSLTTDISGREVVTVCIPIAGGTIQTASIRQLAPNSNVSFVRAAIRFHWYNTPDCSGTATHDTQSQATVTPANTWLLNQYSATAPANAISMKVGLRARRATSSECGGCSNSSDQVYFDQLLLNTPADNLAPLPQGNVTATVISASQINLSWNAATDNLTTSENLHYQICQATTSTGCDSFTVSYTNPIGTTHRSITGLSPNTTYYFRVRVSDEQGNQAFYPQVFATTPPATFNLLSAQADGAYFVKLTFSHPPLPGAGSHGAENPSNYNISPPLLIVEASLASSGSNIVYLKTSKQDHPQTYSVTVNNVQRNSDNASLSNNTANFNSTNNLIHNGSFEADTNSCTSTNTTPPVSYSGICPRGWVIHYTNTTGKSFLATTGGTPAAQEGNNLAQFSHYTSSYGDRDARSICIPIDNTKSLTLSAHFYRTSTTGTSNMRLFLSRFTTSDCSGTSNDETSVSGSSDSTTTDSWISYSRTVSAANLTSYNSVRVVLQMRGSATPNIFVDNIRATQP